MLLGLLGLNSLCPLLSLELWSWAAAVRAWQTNRGWNLWDPFPLRDRIAQCSGDSRETRAKARPLQWTCQFGVSHPQSSQKAYNSTVQHCRPHPTAPSGQEVVLDTTEAEPWDAQPWVFTLSWV